MKPPRVVLDTNVLVSALVFRSGKLAPVREGWQSGRVVPLISAATADEFLRVLGYPKLKLSADEQMEVLADYMPWTEVVRIPEPPPPVPECEDPFDLPFLHLAVAGKARAIVTGDRAILALKTRRGLCPILTVEEFCRDHLS